MKLKTNSWHYKLWSSSFSQFDYKPQHTDLCRYCHRVFWQIILRTFFVIWIAILIGLVCYNVFYKGFFQHTTIALAVTGVIVIVGTTIYLYHRWINGDSLPKEPQTLVGKMLQAKKQRICPLVEFSSEDE